MYGCMYVFVYICMYVFVYIYIWPHTCMRDHLLPTEWNPFPCLRPVSPLQCPSRCLRRLAAPSVHRSTVSLSVTTTATASSLQPRRLPCPATKKREHLLQLRRRRSPASPARRSWWTARQPSRKRELPMSSAPKPASSTSFLATGRPPRPVTAANSESVIRGTSGFYTTTSSCHCEPWPQKHKHSKCGCLLFLLFHRAITEPQDLIMAAVDVKGTMKDFCSIPCLSSFKSKAVLTQTTQSACSASKKPCNGNVRKLRQPSRPPCNQSFINLFFFWSFLSYSLLCFL